jgi:hypothetical protein
MKNVAFARTGVALLALLGLASRASGFQAGITVPGSTAYPQGGMRRVGKMTMSAANYSGLYGGLGDGAGYGYFSTAGAINPGWLIKVDLQGDVPVEVGAASAAVGEGNLDAGAIDPAAGYAYVVTAGSPAHILKFALGAGNAAPTYLGSLTLNAGETSLGAVIDLRDPDPANHYLYVATTTSPAIIVKVAPGAGNALPTRVSSVTLNAGENVLRRGVVDGNGYAYFGTVGGSGTLPQIVKIGMTSGNAAPVRIGSTVLDASTTYSIGSAVIDPANGYGYFGTYDFHVPAKVFKVALGAGANPPVASTSVTLSAGPPAERELTTAVIDTAAGYAYFGTDHTYAAKIFKIKLGAGAAAPTEVGVLQLQSGTQPNPADGVNVLNNPETLYGEVFLQSVVGDVPHGYASWGTDSHKGQVVKTALSQMGALKATKLVLGSGGPVLDAAFYSHVADGNVRLTIYDDASPKQKLWDSGLVLNTGGWIVVPISGGVPSTLSLGAGTYWLAWQVVGTKDVPSYTPGSLGDWFLVERSTSSAPATLSSVTPTSERWSMYIDVGPPPPASFYSVTPCRLLDTRLPSGAGGGPSLQPGGTRTIVVANACGVPLGATAVALNVAVTQSGASGNLTLYSNLPVPPTSTINFGTGQTRANNAIVPLAGGQQLSIYCSMPPGGGATDVIIDVTGYFQ